MAITYVVGIPRSGKTYYVMYQLWKYFIFKPKDTVLTKLLSKIVEPKQLHNYDLAYTNINQFDFSKSDKIKKLDFDDLRLKLAELYSMYMDKKTDEELVQKAKEFNLHNVLITIDEVHNFLGSKVDDVLKWWLTYHGHLYQDLFFITQDLSLVHAQYKSNAEFFFRAVPPSARLFTNKFRYTQYRNARMAMNGKIADFTLPALKEIFEMYVSGAENNSKSVVKKFLAIGLFFSVFLIVGIYFFISSFKNKVEKENNETINEATIQVKQIEKKVQSSISKEVTKDESYSKNSEKMLYEINCIGQICTYKRVNFPKKLLLDIIKENSKYAYKVDNKSFTKYFVLTNKNAFNFLNIGGQEDEKKNKKHNSSPTFNLL